MSLSLKDREWKEFFIEDIVDIVSGKDIYEAERIKGTVPYVTATAQNNGVGYYVGNDNETLESGCISVNRNGSVGYSFYHPYLALFSNDCRKLRLKKKNRYLGLFISSQITAQKGKYGYGYKMGTGRIKRQKIMLPSNGKGEPDYSFMEQYMREQEVKKKNTYKSYIAKRAEELKDIKTVEPLSTKKWKDFFMEDVFNIKSGSRLTKASMNKGKTPFIGATDSNNGITEYISNTNKSLDSNVLGVNYNGSVVENFYHPYKALFSDDVKRLSLKLCEGNKYIYLFMKSAILKQKIKYQYAYKFNGGRMARQKIMLPVNAKGDPDYEYMANFMMALEKRKILSYLNN